MKAEINWQKGSENAESKKEIILQNKAGTKLEKGNTKTQTKVKIRGAQSWTLINYESTQKPWWYNIPLCLRALK